MRTTIRLEEPLLRDARKLAAESGPTLTALFSDALKEALARRRARPEGKVSLKFTTYRGKGTCPGVDLDNSGALLDLLDSNDDAG